MRNRVVLVLVLACAVTACGKSGSSAAKNATTTVASTAPPTTQTPSNLTVTGVSPGVEQAPFYPATTIKAVGCGPVPGGRFVIAIVPAIPGSSTAFGLPTVLIVVPGRAELKDTSKKVLYNEVMPSISTARQAAFVLSLESLTYIGGDRRSVPQGAINVSGDYTCPAKDVAFPGL